MKREEKKRRRRRGEEYKWKGEPEEGQKSKGGVEGYVVQEITVEDNFTLTDCFAILGRLLCILHLFYLQFGVHLREYGVTLQTKDAILSEKRSMYKENLKNYQPINQDSCAKNE